jgi:hypothetical protein
MFRTAAIAALVFLAACEPAPASGQTAHPSDPNSWVIGPILNGRNYSEGVPLHPQRRRGGGWYIDLPRAPGSVHYVTFPHGSLVGKRRIVLRYGVEAAPGVRIAPPSSPTGPAMITPYFQRRGDNWSARGRYEAYRWYGTFVTQRLEPGTGEIIAPLDANWTAVLRSSARTNPHGFREAIADADQVGFVLGGGDGYGHGVFATGPARLIVTEFRVE